MIYVKCRLKETKDHQKSYVHSKWSTNKSYEVGDQALSMLDLPKVPLVCKENKFVAIVHWVTRDS
jgi:hypothetical protein